LRCKLRIGAELHDEESTGPSLTGLSDFPQYAVQSPYGIPGDYLFYGSTAAQGPSGLAQVHGRSGS
jgi:hypothetical protein